MTIKMPMQTETGEIIAVFPERGYTIIRTLGSKPEEFYGHFTNYVADDKEIQKGLMVTFQTNRRIFGRSKRPRALLIEIVRSFASLQGVA